MCPNLFQMPFHCLFEDINTFSVLIHQEVKQKSCFPVNLIRKEEGISLKSVLNNEESSSEKLFSDMFMCLELFFHLMNGGFFFFFVGWGVN